MASRAIATALRQADLILYADVKPLILAMDDVGEVKNVADEAKLRLDWWSARKDLHKALECAAAYVLAAWKGGELLGGLEKNRHSGVPDSVSGTSQYARALEAAQLDERTAQRWQRIARFHPFETVEAYIADCFQKEKIPTFSTLLREASKADLRIVATDIGSWQVEQADVADLSFVESASVDCIITDPPYPKEYLSVYSDLSRTAARVLKPGGSCFVMVGQSYLPEIMARLSEQLSYHWMLAYLTPGGQSVQLFQRSVNTFWKPVLWFINGQHTGKWLGDVCQSNTNDNDKTHHQWGQSESGMASIVGRCSERGQIVLDPFCGAGTTGVAAIGMGRHFLGADSNAACVAKTLARIEQMFEAPAHA